MPDPKTTAMTLLDRLSHELDRVRAIEERLTVNAIRSDAQLAANVGILADRIKRQARGCRYLSLVGWGRRHGFGLNRGAASRQRGPNHVWPGAGEMAARVGSRRSPQLVGRPREH
jgi:hypothetical protein